MFAIILIVERDTWNASTLEIRDDDIIEPDIDRTVVISLKNVSFIVRLHLGGEVTACFTLVSEGEPIQA